MDFNTVLPGQAVSLRGSSYAIARSVGLRDADAPAAPGLGVVHLLTGEWIAGGEGAAACSLRACRHILAGLDGQPDWESSIACGHCGAPALALLDADWATGLPERYEVTCATCGAADDFTVDPIDYQNLDGEAFLAALEQRHPEG